MQLVRIRALPVESAKNDIGEIVAETYRDVVGIIRVKDGGIYEWKVV